MTYSFALNILSSFFGLVASIYFVLGTVILTNDKIEQISATYYDSNIHVKRAFLFQRMDYSFGFIFLIMAFISQTLLALLSKEFAESNINFISYIIFITFLFSTIFISPILRRMIYKKIDKENTLPNR